MVDRSKRQQSWRMFPVRNSCDRKGNLDAGFLIQQKLNVFRCTGGLAQFQLDVGMCECFSILAAEILKTRAFGARGHYDLRWCCGDEIDQGERNSAHHAEGHSESFEQLPPAEPQHDYLPRSVAGQSNRLDRESIWFFGHAGKVVWTCQAMVVARPLSRHGVTVPLASLPAPPG